MPTKKKASSVDGVELQFPGNYPGIPAVVTPEVAETLKTEHPHYAEYEPVVQERLALYESGAKLAAKAPKAEVVKAAPVVEEPAPTEEPVFEAPALNPVTGQPVEAAPVEDAPAKSNGKAAKGGK